MVYLLLKILKVFSFEGFVINHIITYIATGLYVLAVVDLQHILTIIIAWFSSHNLLG